MPSVRRALPPLALALLLAAPGVARADPPRTDSDPCRGHRPGDACEADDFEGSCRPRRCTRETERGMRTFRCLVCESRRHGHHRHRDAAAHEDATVADDVLADAGPDDAADDVAVDATPDGVPDAPARPDVLAARRAPPPPARSLFDCAAAPRSGGDRAAYGALLVAACAALQRRARGRWSRRTGAPL